VLGAAALIVALAGPAAYTLSTVASTKGGAIPLAGPAGVGGAGRFGRGGPAGAGAGGNAFGGPPGFGGQTGGFGPPAGAFAGGTQPGGTQGGAQGGAQPGGRAGGLLNGSNPGAAVTALLERGSSGYRWVAATIGANTAAGYQLASDEPVMAVGGFNGTDPTPTLREFQQYVASGDIHYFIAGGGGPGGGFGGGVGGMGGAGGSSSSNEIRSWVESNFTSRTVDGVTVYDLSSRAL